MAKNMAKVVPNDLLHGGNGRGVPNDLYHGCKSTDKMCDAPLVPQSLPEFSSREFVNGSGFNKNYQIILFEVDFVKKFFLREGCIVGKCIRNNTFILF